MLNKKVPLDKLADQVLRLSGLVVEFAEAVDNRFKTQEKRVKELEDTVYKLEQKLLKRADK